METIKRKVRKPREKKAKERYFEEREELAVKEYLTTTNVVQKNKLFKEIIEPALRELVKGVMKMPKFQKIIGITREELEDNAYYHVIFQLEKYTPGRIGKDGEPTKAYSYYGTVAKNYILKVKQDLDKKIAEYGGDLNVDELHEHIIHTESDPLEFEQSRTIVLKQVEEFLQVKRLTESDVIVANSLKYMLTNWHKLEFQSKNQFVRLLNQYCQLPPEVVARSLNKFKQLFGTSDIITSKTKKRTIFKKLEEKLPDTFYLWNSL